MEEARPLRDVFDDLVALPAGRPPDPATLLREAGHGDLPPELLVPALSGYAVSAPLPVAEAITELSGLDEAGGADPAVLLDGLAGSALRAGPGLDGLDSDPLTALDASVGPGGPDVADAVATAAAPDPAGWAEGPELAALDGADTAFGAGTGPEAGPWDAVGHPAAAADAAPGWDAPGDSAGALDDLPDPVADPMTGSVDAVPAETTGPPGDDDHLDG
jgi:hypothetical protein